MFIIHKYKKIFDRSFSRLNFMAAQLKGQGNAIFQPIKSLEASPLLGSGFLAVSIVTA